jgi:maltose phosphorylase
MKDYLVKHPWQIIEDKFHPEFQKISESIFSIGNGRMGQRANFEEDYSGEMLQGSYLAGIYYPDKTRVGWWKNGYPEYFAKVLNSVNWIGLKIKIGQTVVDLNTCEIIEFERCLDMEHGLLNRKAKVKLSDGKILTIKSSRFYHINRKDLCFLKFTLIAENFSAKVEIISYLDFDVENEDSNYDEKFWNPAKQFTADHIAFVRATTKKTAFDVCSGMINKFQLNGNALALAGDYTEKEKYVEFKYTLEMSQGDELNIFKHVAIVSNFYYDAATLDNVCSSRIEESLAIGFEKALSEHNAQWASKWQDSDIIIEGDVSAQQAIRFNIFQLHQTYTGDDHRLNIGPKGFTGEKYGGSTYWDTEAYCLPFYMSTTKQEVARNLLVYRYKHLEKAIENASKLGFDKGAALYPMVTMNGEECHNEWEITFEEIHRNGAIAYAIYDYIQYTEDWNYLSECGLEVLIAIARFWAQRVNFSEDKQQYVMLGVTGPNEYENNVNNNWYTNYIARWCLRYTSECINYVKENNNERYLEILNKTSFEEISELQQWTSISENIYLPESEKLGIFLQQDGYLDKEQIIVSDLDKKHLPINQNWSWDRILRSVFIKQADVLQGLYFFEEDFSVEQLARNYDFYEPRTVHESSLSPCIHSIQAAKLGREDKAYEMYLRTARLDLDDYNNDTEDGLHITSMAGTWLSIVKGFAGMRISNNQLHFKPFIPKNWDKYQFEILFRGHHLEISITKDEIEIKESNDQGKQLKIYLYGQAHSISKYFKIDVPLTYA